MRTKTTNKQTYIQTKFQANKKKKKNKKEYTLILGNGLVQLLVGLYARMLLVLHIERAAGPALLHHVIHPRIVLVGHNQIYKLFRNFLVKANVPFTELIDGGDVVCAVSVAGLCMCVCVLQKKKKENENDKEEEEDDAFFLKKKEKKK